MDIDSNSKTNVYSENQQGAGKNISPPSILYRLRRSAVQIFFAITASLIGIINYKKEFQIGGKVYQYFHHQYNKTALNERSVEIPLALEFIGSIKGNRILEIGAVLAHYMPVKWDVLDKFEKGEGIINQDVIDFQATEKYDAIVAISTFEHVGIDDDILQPKKSIDGLRNILNQLHPGGRMFLTFPVGYNKTLEDAMLNNTLGFRKIYFLKKSGLGKWTQCSASDVNDMPYGKASAKAIVVAYY